jgi:dihydrofolate reductase
VILGSGSIVAQLAQQGLIDEFQFVVCQVALGQGRTMIEGLEGLKVVAPCFIQGAILEKRK